MGQIGNCLPLRSYNGNDIMLYKIIAELTESRYIMENETQILQLLTGLVDSIEEINSKLEKTENRMDRIDLKFDKLENRLDRMDLKLDKIESHLDSIENQVESIAMGLNKIDLKVSSLDKRKLRRTY